MRRQVPWQRALYYGLHGTRGWPQQALRRMVKLYPSALLPLSDPEYSYGQDAQCTKKNCFIQCMIDQMSRSCLECSYEHCHEAFAECSGVTPIPPKSSARRDLGVPVASHEHARKAAE